MTYFHRFFRTIPGVLAGHWQILLLFDLVFCANELCSTGGEYLGGGLPGLFTLVTIVWHLIFLLAAACVCFAPQTGFLLLGVSPIRKQPQ